MKRKITRKGMTLIEIVISIAIAGILALLLVEIMNVVNATMRSTDYLNRRLAHESKYADNLMPGDNTGGFSNKGATLTIKANSGEFSDIVANGVEYTAHYNDPLMLSDYVSNTNYRFMVFDKTSHSSPVAAEVFWIYIFIGKNLAEKITSIDIDGNCYSHTVADEDNPANIIASGVITHDRIVDSEMPGGKFADTRGNLLIKIPVPGSPDDGVHPKGEGHITVILHKDMYTKTRHEAHPDYVFNTARLTYCTEAKSPSGTTFYDEVYYGFDGEEWKAGDKVAEVLS